MSKTRNAPTITHDAGKAEGITEVRRQEALLKTGALQYAILTSANFSIIATDEKGIIQLFNVGAERMLGYTAAEVVDRISPSDIHDPQQGIEHRARHPRRAGLRGPGLQSFARDRGHL
jgi:PAS domain S-box-containing protein